MEFNPGDLVRLKSGGPLMTVEQVGQRAITNEDAVWCTWFEMVGNRQAAKRETFSPIVLERAQRPGISVGVGRY
jgi:uncharacterized protein YodC (DUF2158 family)